MTVTPTINPEDWYKLIGKPGPTREQHGSEASVSENLVPLKLTNWRLEGNMLMADSSLGTYGHRIPSDLIMTGLNEDGLPILRKVVL